MFSHFKLKKINKLKNKILLIMKSLYILLLCTSFLFSQEIFNDPDFVIENCNIPIFNETKLLDLIELGSDDFTKSSTNYL